MKKWLLFASLATLYLQAAPPASPSLFEQEQHLDINNRILLKINGKPISVMDVVRKMDLIFYRQYPELASSAVARYQFFSQGWDTVLAAVIDDHLIVADAEEKKIEVTEGEVREELEKLFGPDVVMNLDKLGMTLREAMDMLKMELIVQRMNSMMVRSKAMMEVYPKQVKARYEELMQQNPPQSQWIYKVLSIRGEEHQTVANEAYRLLNEQKLPFEEVAAALFSSTAQISLSDSYSREENAISLGHKAILQTLSVGGYSAPISSDSVSRIFCLQEYKSGERAPFNDLAEQIRIDLMQEIAAKYNDTYRQKLRTHYGMTDAYLSKMIPENFVPFALR